MGKGSPSFFRSFRRLPAPIPTTFDPGFRPCHCSRDHGDHFVTGMACHVLTSYHPPLRIPLSGPGPESRVRVTIPTSASAFYVSENAVHPWPPAPSCVLHPTSSPAPLLALSLHMYIHNLRRRSSILDTATDRARINGCASIILHPNTSLLGPVG